MEKFYLSALEVLKEAVSRDFDGKNLRAEKAWGLANGQLSKWFNGTRNPTLTKLAPVLDRLDVTLSLPSTNTFEKNAPADAPDKLAAQNAELIMKIQVQERKIAELEAEIRGMKTAMEYMRPQADSLSASEEGRKAAG